MTRSVSSLLLYALLAAGITWLAAVAALPLVFWLVLLLAPLPLLAASLSRPQRLALYALPVLGILIITLALRPGAVALGLAAAAAGAALALSEWTAVRSRYVAQTATEQNDRLFQALAQATSQLVNAPRLRKGHRPGTPSAGRSERRGSHLHF